MSTGHAPDAAQSLAGPQPTEAHRHRHSRRRRRYHYHPEALDGTAPAAESGGVRLHRIARNGLIVVGTVVLLFGLPVAALRLCVWIFGAERTAHWLLANGWEALLPLAR